MKLNLKNQVKFLLVSATKLPILMIITLLLNMTGSSMAQNKVELLNSSMKKTNEPSAINRSIPNKPATTQTQTNSKDSTILSSIDGLPDKTNNKSDDQAHKSSPLSPNLNQESAAGLSSVLNNNLIDAVKNSKAENDGSTSLQSPPLSQERTQTKQDASSFNNILKNDVGDNGKENRPPNTIEGMLKQGEINSNKLPGFPKEAGINDLLKNDNKPAKSAVANSSKKTESKSIGELEKELLNSLEAKQNEELKRIKIKEAIPQY
ncbi:MAG: hypothetical protein U0X91_05585 [Spirosomataceae bacterium]